MKKKVLGITMLALTVVASTITFADGKAFATTDDEALKRSEEIAKAYDSDAEISYFWDNTPDKEVPEEVGINKSKGKSFATLATGATTLAVNKLISTTAITTGKVFLVTTTAQASLGVNGKYVGKGEKRYAFAKSSAISYCHTGKRPGKWRAISFHSANDGFKLYTGVSGRTATVK